jgi:hypothetical protein
VLPEGEEGLTGLEGVLPKPDPLLDPKPELPLLEPKPELPLLEPKPELLLLDPKPELLLEPKPELPLLPKGLELLVPGPVFEPPFRLVLPVEEPFSPAAPPDEASTALWVRSKTNSHWL